MKKIRTTKLCAAVALAAITAVSCQDMLDTRNDGSTITESQKINAGKLNPALFIAELNSMYALMMAYHAGSDGWATSNYHNDFGMSAIALMMESNGQDLYCPLGAGGYNWFGTFENYNARAYESAYTRIYWALMYKQIRSANALIASIPADSEGDLKAYRGQALAFRAYNYWYLAQTHQFTYKGNEDKRSVPIVTEETIDGHNPRSTVKQVYDQILRDLGEAITLLKGYKQANKGYIDEAVAYGLRARTYLVMQEYAKAATDADSALSLSKAQPYSLADVSKPAFNTATHPSVMWANLITPENDVVASGIINWPSHLCSFSGNGYVSVGALRCASKLLYDQIPASDVRKGWFLDDNKESPLVRGSEYDAWRASFESYITPRLNVKFAAYENKPLNVTNAQDWTLMRAEEMLLIKAEGLAKGGQEAAGRQALESFVQTYRNPSYSITGDLSDAIWLQRRIELWGEGFSFFDIMRLQKPITRVGAGYAATVTFDIDAGSDILLWMIPQSETESNHAITHPADNNPVASPPKPVSGS